MRKLAFHSFFALTILIVITYTAFYLMDLRPYKAEEEALRKVIKTEEAFEAQLEKLGYRDPIHIKYIRWGKALLKGDLGHYYDRNKPVSEYLFKYMGRTLLLNGVAFMFAISIALPLGVYAATREKKLTDFLLLILTMLFTAIPSFYFGLLGILGLVRNFPGLLPVSGMGDIIHLARGYPDVGTQLLDLAYHLILPVLSIAIVWVGMLTPHIRVAMIEILHQDYIRTAKAKGLNAFSVLFKHGLKNAILPIIALTALIIPTLIISNILVEKVFSWPGMGLLFVESLYRGERDMVLSIVLVYTILVITGNSLSDALSSKVDIRIKEDRL